MTETLPLAAEFPATSREDWLGLVAKVLKGADPARVLVRRTYDDLPVQALYTRDMVPLADAAGAPGAFPYLRGAVAGRRGWDVRMLVSHPDPAEAARQVGDDLANGAGSILLRLDSGLAEGGDQPDGVLALDPGDLERILADLAPDRVPVALDGAGLARTAAMLLAWAERRGLRGRARLELGLDPLAVAATGRCLDLEQAQAEMAEIVRQVLDGWPGVLPLRADGAPYHGAGASAAQELAAMMASAVDHLRLLESKGIPPERAVPLIGFRVVTDTDLFTGIAKLRAARLLWARIAEAVGADAAGMRLDAIAAERMMTRYDPHTNLLRGTLACVAAALGGAEAITLLPFDHATGLASPFARRLARNTQLVLQGESGLGLVQDPAGGAWLVEDLTRRIAGEAWSLFQTIDGGGGMAEQLRRGTIQEWIAATWAQRAANLARRRDPVTGISEFPSLAEPPPPAEPWDPASLVAEAQGRLADAVLVDGEGVPALLAAFRAGRPVRLRPHRAGFTPLGSHRLAEGFEALRQRSDARLAAHGRRPRMLLARLGSESTFTARNGFAVNLLMAGGIEPWPSPPLAKAEAAVAAWRESGADLAALVADDEHLASLGPEVATALHEAGCTDLHVFGRPAAAEAALLAAGAKGLVRAGDDVLAWLEGLHETIEAAAGEEP